ncbi:MAG TPA: NADH-quinone oxidoreductase subunit J [Bacteroidota bacterium]|nr:NADH-quinone oxidoreductase subunit J [Bacteroidota bacterium]
MELFDIVFYLFAVLTLVSAFVVVSSKNIVRSAFSLLFTFFGVSGLYVLLMADFLAITQLMIYVGGILVLLIFGVMLTSRQINVDAKTGTIQTLPAVLIAAAIAGTLIGMFWSTDWLRTGSLPDTMSSGKNIGNLLLSSYVLPFEIASVVLLVALIGAAMIARREKKA